jgi:hypothetical protein
MKRQKVFFSIVALAMIAGTAVLLAVVPQKLGPPGVKANPIPGEVRWRIDLPEVALGYVSTNHELDGKALEMLPKDTSFAEREYYRADSPPIGSSVILMGTDRTSIHKAQYCLQGEGMHIDRMTRETIHLYKPQPYDLPVIKIVGSGSFNVNGETKDFRCIYVYWYVADGILSNDPSGFHRMWSMAKELMLTGTLQRWAYVRFYAVCMPGQEDAMYERIKQMITVCVPQFQLTPKPLSATATAQP